MQAWAIPDAAKLLGVPYRTLKRWVDDDLVTPRLRCARTPWGRCRLLEDEVLELWAIHSLRHQGVSLQAIRRILVRLSGMRLTDFKAIIVQGEDVIGVRDGPVASWERLRDGQQVIRLDTLRERLTRHPGERLSEVWELVLSTPEVSYGGQA